MLLVMSNTELVAVSEKKWCQVFTFLDFCDFLYPYKNQKHTQKLCWRRFLACTSMILIYFNASYRKSSQDIARQNSLSV